MQSWRIEFISSFAVAMLAVLSTVSDPALAVRAGHEGPTLEDLHAAEAESGSGIEMVASNARGASIVSPQASEWRRVPATTVPVYRQTILEPQGGGSITALSLKVLRLYDGVAFYLEWSDGSLNDRRNSLSPLCDAVAIEFPIDNSGDTRLAMGHSGGPVNILSWRADLRDNRGKGQSEARELVAEGTYDRRAKDDSLQLLQSQSRWANGKWSVVIFKPTNRADKASPQFEAGVDVPIAFAVWNGGAGDRLGLKSVSNWTLLRCR